MSEQIPYNDNQWNDVPLPDGDAAWQKMELLLEKKKKRRMAWWFWPTAITLIAGLLIAGGLWIYGDNDHQQAPNNGLTSVNRNDTPTTNQQTTSVNTGRHRITANDNKDSTTILSPPNKKEQATIIIQKESRLIDSLHKEVSRNESPQHLKKEPALVKKKVGLRSQQDGVVKEADIMERSILIQSTSSFKQKVKAKADSNAIKKDTTHTNDTTSITPIQPTTADSTYKKIKKKHTPVLSAGIGIQQYITLANQQASPYNYNGTRNLLTDHIPSLYVRWQHNKWYVQAEVAYAAPQPVRKFFFSETEFFDSAANTLRTEKFSVQKLYYHQLALNINRFILPDWSVGIGGLYNLLAGDVQAKETTIKNISTGQVTTVEKIIPVKGSWDSLLVHHKSIAFISLQTEYQWKRLSIGLRYTKSLQPYIRYYTAIDERKEKNQLLQATLRFRLWPAK